jgi:hypothetical protein
MHCKFSTRGDWQGVGCKALSTWCAVDIFIYKIFDENIMEGCLCNEVLLKKNMQTQLQCYYVYYLLKKAKKVQIMVSWKKTHLLLQSKGEIVSTISKCYS